LTEGERHYADPGKYNSKDTGIVESTHFGLADLPLRLRRLDEAHDLAHSLLVVRAQPLPHKRRNAVVLFYELLSRHVHREALGGW
jgi:hypothetical protein